MITLNEVARQYPPHLQKPEFYDQMIKEYIHFQMLKILFSGKNAGKICFLGGTALRYLYDVKRFSEDLDFDSFNLSREEFYEMTGNVEKEIRLQGYDVMIEDKEKHLKLKAFRRVFVFPELKYKMGISQQKQAKFFIKIEAEPHGFEYTPQVKPLNRFGVSVMVNTVPLGIIFASKIAAALNRKKDRDFFDIISLIDFADPDYAYLKYRCDIDNSDQLKQKLLLAAAERKLEKRSVFDCEHMLIEKSDMEKLKNFSVYISNFDFNKLS